MKYVFSLAVALACIGTAVHAQKGKFEQDRQTILALAGCYKVTFDFAETFAPDTNYEYHDRYRSSGIEYVRVIADNGTFISLQHLLVVNDSIIVKHWRQDWVYENRELLQFDRDRTWKKHELSKDEAQGTWTQKVFQVDDSPRYESYGTWVHLNGKHYWEGTGDAPLPRREFSKRSDYNVMKRKSRMELTDYGWILEQDNQKIIRDESGDKLLCWEKGHERFLTGDYNCQPAIDWWEKNEQYWNEVRVVWNEVFGAHQSMHLTKKVEDKMLWQQLFALGNEWEKAEAFQAEEARKQIRSTIESYLKAS